MAFASDDKFLARLLASGAGFTTVFVVSGSVTDPVNVPKLLGLGVFSSAAFAFAASSKLRNRIREVKWQFAFMPLFLACMLTAVAASNSPLSQNIYGTYGRNNGLLAYFFLGLIFLCATLVRQDFEQISKSLLVAGSINVIYCLWVVMFGDFIGWSNPYGNILGTLGNPNFIGSFLGIFLAAFLAFALDKQTKKFWRISAWFVIPITAFEIVKSHAIQGRVVAVLGIGILGFLYLRDKIKRIFLVVYAGVGITAGIFAVMGALQIGPLSSLIYKTSVSLRGQYWLAGWNTGSTHPFTGVGMDAFGDWYRRSRDAHALVLPGPDTVVNASHNVPIDLFAFGGWPLFTMYLLLVISALIAAIRVVLRTTKFDSTFAILFTSWIGYQAQSIISINQIGLAVWGWLLSGALIGFEISTRNTTSASESLSTEKQSRKRNQGNQPKAVVFASIGGLIGLILALPPLTSDSKWRSAQMARSVEALEGSLKPSYFNPPNSSKYLMSVQSLEESGLFDLSHKYALLATEWNPENFDSWKILYLLKNTTEKEKEIALAMMKQLDPLNPNVVPAA